MNKNKLQIYIFTLLGIGLLLFALWPWWVGVFQSPRASVDKNSGGVLISNEVYSNVTSSLDIADSAKILSIPSIGVNIPIIIGDNGTVALGQGAWHIPGSGLPDEPDGYKNIVLSAHRFLYTTGPNTFFNLDKVVVGDEMTINWEGQEYKYQVADIFVVEPEQVSILADDGKEKLTLFTCTPVFTTDKRLVVVAYPVE